VKSLFELTSDVLELEALLTAADGEIPDEETERALDEYMAQLDADLHAKLDGYVMLIAEFDARAEARLNESKRVRALADADEAHAERLRERLKAFFVRTGRDKVETARFRVSLTNAGGKLPLKLHCQPEQLPEEFRKERVTFMADQDAIRKALEGGEKLVFAELGERGKVLRIK
jgi:Siphovirus Gp157